MKKNKPQPKLDNPVLFGGYITTRKYDNPTPVPSKHTFEKVSAMPRDKLEVGTKVRLVRPSMWDGYEGQVSGYATDLLHHPKVVGLHLVRVKGEGIKDFDCVARFDELQILSETTAPPNCTNDPPRPS